MCSSACKHARPGTACHCDCRRRNHGIYFRRYAVYRPYSRPIRRVVPREYVRPRITRPPRPEPISSHRRSWGPGLVKSAVIGVSCAAFPGAWPAIVAFGKYHDLYVAAKGIVDTVRSDRRVPGTLALDLYGHLTREVVAHVAGPWSRIVSDAITSKIAPSGLTRPIVQRIVASTIAGVMTDEIGPTQWGIKE